MEAYSSFAQVYDLFMDNIPYDEWTEEIVSVLKADGKEDGIVADLGCGTGQMTRRLAAAGYDMIGIDSSPEMLSVALSRESLSSGILYLQQDLLSFELYGTVAACVCVCDTLNYLPSREDLIRFFRLVNNYLDPGGLFLFDCNTPVFYEAIGDDTIAENRDEASFIWENEYDAGTLMNEYRMTFYIRAEESGDGFPGESPLYRRFEEVHVHRAYSAEVIRECLLEAGMIPLSVCDADDGGSVREDTARIFVTAREHGKG